MNLIAYHIVCAIPMTHQFMTDYPLPAATLMLFVSLIVTAGQPSMIFAYRHRPRSMAPF